MPNSRISILLDNQAGALARAVTLFRRRSFNIIALSVGETQDRAVSRMTIISDARPDLVEHVRKQLQKQEYVHAAEILPPEKVLSRELMLVKLNRGQFTDEARAELAKEYDFRVLEQDEATCMIECTADTPTLDDFMDKLTPLGLMEMSRTGETALVRGDKTLYKYAIK